MSNELDVQNEEEAKYIFLRILGIFKKVFNIVDIKYVYIYFFISIINK